MRLDAEEEAMLAGELGEPRRFALAQQLAVGRFFDAEDFVAVSQAHVMADGEAVGAAGTTLLERLAAAPPGDRRVRVPTVTDPRGVDPKACTWLRQPEHAPERERRIVEALRAMGVLLTNTCINYQIVAPPVRGEHVAFGDTGSTIYANGVLGARSNFEGGVAALWAALTGRVPRYGFHLDEVRRGTRAFRVEAQPEDYADWGALGAVIGKRMGSYWDVPVLTGIQNSPGSDELKHFGAALASWGSTPMFHIIGVTPEAPDEKAAFGGPSPVAVERIGDEEIRSFYSSFARDPSPVDVVVFAAPQLSLLEVERLARLLEGRHVAAATALLAAVPPAVASEAERLGLKATIEAAGGRLLEGVCFYQMYAREMGQAMGWRHLVTNSAKLANIIQGYGYTPVLQPTAACVEAAVRGRLA
jgi:predicted aconitase